MMRGVLRRLSAPIGGALFGIILALILPAGGAIFPPIGQLLLRADFSSAHTVVPTDFATTLRGDATSGAFAFTLPATAGEGNWVGFRKSDTSANRVTVKYNGGADGAWLSAQYDEAIFAYWNGAWVPLRWRIADLIVEFTANGTATTPPLARQADLTAWGGGGGGGSGRRGAAGSARSAGLGGFGTLPAQRWGVPASALGASTSMTIGAGGTAGAAVTADDTSGNPGGTGGDTTIGSQLRGRGCYGGPGGTAAGTTQFSDVTLDAGGCVLSTSSVVTAQQVANNAGMPLGGGAGGVGGGLTTGNVEIVGQRGGFAAYADPAVTVAAAGASGAAGGNGATSSLPGLAGTGGGGGGASAALTGGAGGNGGLASGGGGGGAASNTHNSGAGGTGGGGKAMLNYRFN